MSRWRGETSGQGAETSRQGLQRLDPDIERLVSLAQQLVSAVYPLVSSVGLFVSAVCPLNCNLEAPDMALVCGIDLGSFNTPSYVAWLEDGEILLGSYTASVEQPLPPAPGGWAPAFTAIDGPQGLPVPGRRTRLCDREAGVPTKSLPTSREELATWPLYRPFLTAGVELFWSVHEREIASVLGLVLLSDLPEAGIICETYPRYVASRLWPGWKLPSKRRTPAVYVETVWSRLRAAGYTCANEIVRPDHVDAMLCAVAAEACLREDGIPAGTVGEAPLVDPAGRLLREGFLIAPA